MRENFIVGTTPIGFGLPVAGNMNETTSST
jgi:hypothetical protein